MKSLLTTLSLAVTLVLGANGLSEAILLNGDFSNGLTGWGSGGSVSVVAGAASLNDNGVPYSFLYQEAAFAAGSYTLEFNYRIQSLGSAPVTDPFALNDLFAASLYFANGTGQINPNIDPLLAVFPNPSNAISLFSIDNTANTGVQHFSLNFTNTYAYIIPTFELFDLNFNNNDSSVLIDNVKITEAAPVPEPATLLLLGGGLLGLLAVNKRRSRGAA